MNNLQVCETNMPEIKVWNGQRVVTFKDIDTVHQRPKGTASRNFKSNKKHFIENEDYIMLHSNGRNSSIDTKPFGKIPPKGLMLLTESGYLMIVKSFTDDLSWDVQRQLVNGYFKVREASTSLALPMQSSTPVPKRPDWYAKNFDRIEAIKEKFDADTKMVYHQIFLQLRKKYDINAANEIYKKEMGYYPTYAMDIIPYFPELTEETDRILDMFLQE